ncbi:MAG: energy transducer TonB [Acidobacteria bacterium]|nr:energy transducer TonB [Acidobacteriota bacterium]
MYFDFEDYRPETPTLESAISRREGILLSVVVHAVLFAAVLFAPQLPFVQQMQERARELALARIEQQRQQAQADETRFVFVQPRLDTPAPAPPPRAFMSDQDRVTSSPERAPNPSNPLPFARGNSAEFVENQVAERPRGQGPDPDRPPSPATAESEAAGSNGNTGALAYDAGRGAAVSRREGESGLRPGGGALGEALRNLQRYTQDQSFENPQGGGAFGPAIQFDTKGVEFGPWIRRFVAQIKRNWFIPYAAMSLRGHVVITFNVHKDGRISDLQVVGPSSTEAFNNAAFNALVASNPTHPLPPEYPADKAFFTVTFYYNEQPPSP